MARLMCVGIATLDIVNRVARYPEEDTEVRALGQSQRLGGNAANTATVLAQLGAGASWVGNLAEAAQIVEQGFTRYGVDTSLAVRIPDAVMPTSYILLSEANGSRSILHVRDLPEYHAGDFRALDLTGFDWVHFEGRAVEQLPGMIGHAREFGGLSVSLEAEKPRPGIEALFAAVDLLMVSRDYALAKGFADAPTVLRSLPAGIRGSCTWGAHGAWARGLERVILGGFF